MKPAPQTILVGVTGGIAAYKAVEIVSSLRQQGHQVHVAMTPAACRFVSPLTFEAVSGQQVLTETVPTEARGGEASYPHLYPATRTDLFVVVPCTANTLAKLAHGYGDDIVSCSALSLPASCQRLICPAMNVEMWEQPVVQDNLATLERRGWERIGPEVGHLACGMTGPGRMASPRDILQVIEARLNAHPQLQGRRVMVLSGPTREHLDPIRYIGNPSSGKMGRAIAEAAVAAGADVDFVTGPVRNEELPRHPSIKIHPVVAASEMLEKARELHAQMDLGFFVAAVADYAPSEYHTEKRPKAELDLHLHLVPTPDIAATLGEDKQPHQVHVGFALQTGEGIEESRAKLIHKQFDGIVLNHPDSLGGEGGTFTWIGAAEPESPVPWGRLDKRGCAARIMERAASLFGSTLTETQS